MSDIFTTIIVVIVMVLLFFLGKKIVAWKMNRAFLAIVKDLKTKGALDPESAIMLSYAKKSRLKFGMRDYRPRVLPELIKLNILGMTQEGKFYLNETALPPL